MHLDLYCTGVNHSTAPIEVRERLQAIHADAAGSRSELASRLARIGVREYALLATCNRVELYTVGPASSPAGAGRGRHAKKSPALVECIAAMHNWSPAGLEACFYHHAELDAVRHLSRVACGLDSLVLGETQIQGQVAACLASAIERQTVGPVLTEVFQTAIQCGKRARSETCIGCNPSSVSTAAVRVAEGILGDLGRCRVLLIGAGEMGGLALKAFTSRGASTIDVVSRSIERARETARLWRAAAHGFDALDALLRRTDVVLTSTSAETTILSRSRLERIMHERGGRTLLIVDIAVPRDVEPEAGDIPGVCLLNMDSLEDTVHEGLAERQHEVPLVEALIEEAIAGFPLRLHERTVRPLIASLRRAAESVRTEELTRLRNGSAAWDDRTWNEIDRFSRKLVHRLLKSPTERLRGAAPNDSTMIDAETVRRIFSLDRSSAS